MVSKLLHALTASFITQAIHTPVSMIDVVKITSLEQSEVAHVIVQSTDNTTIQLLIKRYDLKSLMARVCKPQVKWHISALSFENEFRFLKQVLLMNEDIKAWMAPAGGLPDTLSVTAAVNPDDWFDRCYDFVVSYLDPAVHCQAHQLDMRQARGAIRWLARFHALWWVPRRAHPHPHPHQDQDQGRGHAPAADHAGGGSEGQEQSAHSGHNGGNEGWRAGLFPRGGWWRKPLRPSVDYASLPTVFRGLCAFPHPHLLGSMNTEEGHAAMRYLADRVDDLTSTLEACPDRTIVHGDFKTSNMFFARQHPAGDDDTPTVQAIDWQWTGRAPSGLADVVYLVYGGVAHSALEGGGEEALLRAYHRELGAALAHRGLHPDTEFSWDDLCAHLALETCAYAATAVPQLLAGLDASVCAHNAGKFGWLTHEEDPGCAALLCRRAVQAAQQAQAAGGFAHCLRGDVRIAQAQ